MGRVFMNKKKIKWKSLPIIHFEKKINNPYRGFYSVYRFYAKDRIWPADTDACKIDFSDNILCLVEINLGHYNDVCLTSEALENIKSIVEYFIVNGKQLILRFLYDWDGKGIVSEPKDISFIIKHIRKLSSVLKFYEKEIYIVQGLFIGSWGEMHDSRYLNTHHLTALANELYDATGNLTQIALRSPSFIRSIFRSYKPINENESFSLVKKSRFSLFNDAIMASETDLGTYGDIKEKEFENYSDKWIKEDELKYQYAHCRYVSNGGEVVKGIDSKDTKTIIKTLKTMRISYLNDGHDMEVLNKWKETILDASFGEYKGKSLFEYIENHLGYRYTIKNVKVLRKFSDKDNFSINIQIANEGFSPSYHKFNVFLAIKNTDNSQINEYNIQADTRYWLPGDIIEIDAKVNIPGRQNKMYIVAFKIYDERSNRSIEIMNKFSKMDFNGYYDLGHLHIKDCSYGRIT